MKELCHAFMVVLPIGTILLSVKYKISIISVKKKLPNSIEENYQSWYFYILRENENNNKLKT